jgi:sugar transport system substrate-binding protein
MRKSSYLVVGALVALFSLTAVVAASAQAKAVVAGVVLHEDQQHKIFTAGFKAGVIEQGLDFVAGISQTDPAKEVELINTYLLKGVKGLAIIPINPESSIVTLKKAAEKGMKIVICDNPLKDSSFVNGTVLSDNFSVGQLTGAACREFIQKKLGGKANIAGLGYYSLMPESSGSPNVPGGRGRWDGFLSEVKKLPGVKIVAYQDAWVQDKALPVAIDMLTAHPEVNILYSANEGGTVGETMAVANTGKKGKVFVFGTDGSDQLIQMLKDPANILQAITAQDSFKVGYTTGMIAAKAVKGEDVSKYKGVETQIPGFFLSRQDPKRLDEFVAMINKYTGGN